MDSLRSKTAPLLVRVRPSGSADRSRGLLRRWNYYRSTAHFSNGNSANRQGRDGRRRRHGDPSRCCRILPQCRVHAAYWDLDADSLERVPLTPGATFNRYPRSSSVLDGARPCRSPASLPPILDDPPIIAAKESSRFALFHDASIVWSP